MRKIDPQFLADGDDAPSPDDQHSVRELQVASGRQREAEKREGVSVSSPREARASRTSKRVKVDSGVLDH
jgi:hypothetical protein